MTIMFGRSSEKALADLSPEEFQKKLDWYKRHNERSNLIFEASGSSPFGSQPRTLGASTSVGGDSSNTNSLFGGGGLLGGSFDDIFNRSKDMARFRLGLDQDQARFFRGLREEESQADFGRNFRLQDQQIQGNQRLQDTIQNATTNRLQRQLDNQSNMQQRGFDQQNLFRAQSAALALRGLR